MISSGDIAGLAKYVVDQTAHVCRTFGSRDPGSEGESAAQDYVCEQLAPHADDGPVKEPFPVGPRAFMGFQRVTSVFLFIGLVGFWFYPIISVAASLLALFIAVQVLLRYKLLLEPFSRSRTSHNVAAVRKSKGETKRRIIINGHIDAVYEWRWHYHFPKQFPLFILYTLLAGPALLAVALVFTIFNFDWSGGYANVWGVAGAGTVLLWPAVPILFLFSDFNTVVDGANDNLTGTFITLALAKWMGENDIRLENTEVMYLITGSEEAGLRGAKAYAKRHRDELHSIETVFVAIDTIRDLDYLKIYNKDLNGTVEHDARVAKMFKEASANAGLDLPYGTVTIGSSDATAFTQEGVPSIAIAAMDPAPADYYHTRKDTPDNMNPECIEKTIALIAEAVSLYDAKGLDAFD